MNMDPFEIFNKEIQQKFEDEILENNSSTLFSTAKKETCIDDMLKEVTRVSRRYGRILVIEDKYLPEDCFGILIVRPEDAKDFQQIKNVEVENELE